MGLAVYLRTELFLRVANFIVLFFDERFWMAANLLRRVNFP